MKARRWLLWCLPLVAVAIFVLFQPEDRSKGSAYYRKEEAQHYQPLRHMVEQLKALGFLAQLKATDEGAVRQFAGGDTRADDGALPAANAPPFEERLLAADTQRVLVYRRDQYRYENKDSQPHTAMLKRLAEISRGKFAPQNIVEAWDVKPDQGGVPVYRGNVKVSFKYDGKDFSYATSDVDPPAVRSIFLKTLNAALGPVCRFATTPELDVKGRGLVVAVSDEERQALSAATGLIFAFPE